MATSACGSGRVIEQPKALLVETQAAGTWSGSFTKAAYWSGYPDVPYVLVMASLAGFLGALTASFAKELGGALGKASAEAIVSAARRLSYHVRDKAHDGSLEFHATDHILRITHAGDLPDAAWRQLVELDFPQPPAEQLMELRWDSAAGRWRWHPRERRRRHSDS